MEPNTLAPGGRAHAAFGSIVDLIRHQATMRPDLAALIFLSDGEIEAGRLTYRELDQQARAFAARLQTDGLNGQAVLLMLPSSIHYVIAFLGSLYAGAIPVPVYPPTSSTHAERLAQIVRDCNAKAVILATSSSHENIQARLEAFFPEGTQCEFLSIDEPSSVTASDWTPPILARDTLAYLQYTSGSTSQPRGVMVSHGNLLEHCRHLQEGLRQDHSDVYVTWLPLFHDLGLIAGVLQPFYLGATSVLMPSMAFLQRPLRWLEAISRYRGTASSAPNFAYELCATTLDEDQIRKLDLSRWSFALNGAEPVRASTIRKFCERFASCGFRPEAMNPAYGLAEATLTVSYGAMRSIPAICEVDADALARQRFVPSSGMGKTRALVGCGRSWLNIRTEIVDPDTGRPCEEGEIGEIWVHGPTVADGYWQRPEDTDRMFRARLPDGDGPFLRTGDLGILHQDMLYVTGRIKDLVIIRGRNHYPQDIEQTMSRAHAAVEAEYGAAFSIDVDGEEKLAVVQEIRRSWRKKFDGDEIVQAIRAAVAEEHGVQVHAVLLLRPASVHITSSGKIQRQACRKYFLEGGFDPLYSWIEPVVDDDAEQHDPVQPAATTEHRPNAGSLLSQDRVPEHFGAMTPEQLDTWAQSYLLESACAILKLGPERKAELAPMFQDLRLNQIGLDSLSAIDLCNKTLSELAVDVPVHYFLGSATVSEVSRLIGNQLMLKSLVQGPDDAVPDGAGMEAFTL